ncbi:MAG: hypothetical protein U9R56_03910 [candidate division Zixibacteria bacterium]|nr:hypothetical protein [candidate division Zixibacteria bacterium]
MRFIKPTGIMTGLVLFIGLVAWADTNGRIYGKLETIDGYVYEGLIRWDKNEGNWVDVLDGTKELSRRDRDNESRRRKYRDREHSIEIFGFKISKVNSYWNWSSSAQSGIRFGHIKTLEVIDDDAVLLMLKSGEELRLENGSTDIGSSIREIVIEDERDGEIELIWDDIETIDFMQAPSDIISNFGERLYGTLISRRGDEYTGFVCWDVDELFTRDILDGDEDRGRRKRKLKFGKIKSIERYSSSRATVTLINGDEIILCGTNDVDESNRGIVISDPGFGQVVVDWDEFDRLDFKRPPRSIEYKEFDGGRPLEGTVYTEDGNEYSGRIRWDDDEEYTWEILNGEYRNVEYDIEFGLIKEIQKRSYRSAVVTVLDGRSFRLRGSNDVDEDNKGIFITTSDGEEVEIFWEDFDRLEFVGN